jgi:hypothetical protein
MFLKTMNGKLTTSINIRLLLMNKFNHSIKRGCMMTKTWRKAWEEEEQLHVDKSHVEAMKKSHWRNNKIIYH